MEQIKKSSLSSVAVIGNYLPRQCGIATFTSDLCESLGGIYKDTTFFALPVNDVAEGYKYPPRVRFELAQNEVDSYRRAADFLNLNNVDLVCLQHEYGIFGGPAGSHILTLLRELRMPLVTTLHTVLKKPDDYQRKVMKELSNISDRIVVMSQKGAGFLKNIYGVSSDKIDVIHHGIPDVPFVDPNFYKDLFGVQGNTVLLTFGLLSPSKGIENVINALPEIKKKYPDIVYIVLGTTHPHVKRHEGEAYRLHLERLAQVNGVEKSVIFYNQFVSSEELLKFIGAADIYITPYLNEQQITSGTLAYTVGAGKAVISTPYWHAEELLSEGRGIIVPFGDPISIANEVINLLDNETERHAIRKRAYMYGRDMIWENVTERYMESFERARSECSGGRGSTFICKALNHLPRELPAVNLGHLWRMTDNTGILQHAIFTVPNYDEGYTTDDNARALIVTTLLEEFAQQGSVQIERLATRFLSFLWHAFNPETGRFRNFLSYDRTRLDEVGSEDSHARALWALGTVLGRSDHHGLRGLAGRLFEAALPASRDFTFPRSWAYTLVAIHEYLRRFYGDRTAQDLRAFLAEKLLDLYRENSLHDWPWFEDRLTYCNARLPHALMMCGQWMSRPDMAEAGLKSLEWLAGIQKSDQGHFSPIGCNGFYYRGEECARFDQQPVEVQPMISACLEAYNMTGDSKWLQEAQTAFDWFMGRNELGEALYDSTTGGCRDGLHPDRTNQNQGAESTLAFLMSLLEMRLAQHAFNPVLK